MKKITYYVRVLKLKTEEEVDYLQYGNLTDLLAFIPYVLETYNHGYMMVHTFVDGEEVASEKVLF